MVFAAFIIQWLIEKLFPLREEDRLSPEEFEQVAQDGRRLEIQTNVLMITLWVLLGLVIVLICPGIDSLIRISKDPQYDGLRDGGLLYGVGAFLVGAIPAIWIANAYAKHKVAGKYELYLRYWGEHSVGGYRYDVRRATKLVMPVLWFFGAASLLAAPHARVMIDQRGITCADGFLSTKTYPYAEVRRIEVCDVPSRRKERGQIGYGAVEIRLSDGNGFRIDLDSWGITPEDVKRIAEHVARESGISLIMVPPPAK